MNAPLATHRYAVAPVVEFHGVREETTVGYVVADAYQDAPAYGGSSEDDARAWLAEHQERTPYGHYRAAEQLLHEVETYDDLSPQAEARLLRLAHIHATLATTGPHPMWVEGAP